MAYNRSVKGAYTLHEVVRRAYIAVRGAYTLHEVCFTIYLHLGVLLKQHSNLQWY